MTVSEPRIQNPESRAATGRRFGLRWLAVLAAMLLVLGACSSDSGGDDGVASLEDTATETTVVAGGDSEEVTVSDQEILNEFAACMRDNGVEDFEDPIVNADGSVEFGFGGGGELAADDREAMEAAFAECGDLIDGLSFGPGGADFDITEIEDQLVAFAACMRDQGIDLDDPDLSDFAPGGDGDGRGGPFGDIDIDDPDVQAALEVCQDEIAFAGRGG